MAQPFLQSPAEGGIPAGNQQQLANAKSVHFCGSRTIVSLSGMARLHHCVMERGVHFCGRRGPRRRENVACSLAAVVFILPAWRFFVVCSMFWAASELHQSFLGLSVGCFLLFFCKFDVFACWLLLLAASALRQSFVRGSCGCLLLFCCAAACCFLSACRLFLIRCLRLFDVGASKFSFVFGSAPITFLMFVRVARFSVVCF